MYLYVDGVLDATGNKYLATSSTNVRIGRVIDNDGEYFDGYMDEVRVWNYARSSSEINVFKYRQVSASEPGLVAYYQFNQGIPDGDNTGISKIIATVGADLNIVSLSRTGSSSNFVTYTGPNTAPATNCTPYTCLLPSIPNGSFSSTNGTNHGSVFTFSCNAGFVLSGQASAVCNYSQLNYSVSCR